MFVMYAMFKRINKNFWVYGDTEPTHYTIHLSLFWDQTAAKAIIG